MTNKIGLYPSNPDEEKIFENTFAQLLPSAVHPEDAPYLAVASILGYPVWTNDKDFTRQEKIRVITTKELVEQLAAHSLKT